MNRIESTALDVLERLVEATYTRECRGLLHQANLGLIKLRHLLRRTPGWPVRVRMGVSFPDIALTGGQRAAESLQFSLGKRLLWHSFPSTADAHY